MTSPAHQQHDLHPPIAQALVRDLRLSASDTVYEVGPGMGALTGPILASGARMVAVEIDPERAAHIRRSYAAALKSEQLRLLCCDARRFIPDVQGPWRVIANPPFQHTAELLNTWLLESSAIGFPRAMDLVLQHQTAVKLVGETNHWTRSSILLRLLGKPQVAQRLRRHDVTPPARVDLSWLSWRAYEQHEDRDIPDSLRLRQVATLLEQAFRGDHSVRQALRGVATGPILKRQGKLCGWNPEGPARAVPPAAWLSLSDFLAGIGRL